MRVRIVQIEAVARRAKALSLAGVNGGALPKFVPGSHIKIGVPHVGAKGRSPFSLTGPSGNASRYQIVVHRHRASASVTRWLHDHASPGDMIEISEPKCGLKLVPSATRHCLIAGGSGITAFLSHLDQLRKEGREYALHYALASKADGIYCDELSAHHGDRFKLYVSARGVRLRIRQILLAQATGTHVYVCGPRRLIQNVLDAARAIRFPLPAVHWDIYGWQPDLGIPEEGHRPNSDYSAAKGCNFGRQQLWV